MEDNKFKITDLGIVVTIGGILLYSLGWVYWKTYFKGLNIDISFIDLTIDRIIATTWLYVYVIIAPFLFAIYNMFNKNLTYYDKSDLKIIFTMGFLSLVLLENSILQIVLICVLYIVFLIGYHILSNRINFLLELKMRKSHFAILFYFILYILCFCYCDYTGRMDVDKFINNYKVNVTLTKKDTSAIQGKFIGLMRNTYFILVKNKSIYETYGIREDEVAKIKLTDKLLIKKPLN